MPEVFPLHTIPHQHPLLLREKSSGWYRILCIVVAVKVFWLDETGGETPIAHSALVYERLQAQLPELVANVHKRGLGMKMLFRAPGKEGKGNEFNWAGEHSFGQELLPGDDRDTVKAKVEKQVRKLTTDSHWTEDDSIELTQHIPGK
jgi:hypothetical protein